MHHVLVIDDDAQVRNMLDEMLTRLNCRVTSAGSGQDGLAALERESFHLVITDLLMPEMDGLETIRHIKSARSEIPVVALTGGGPFSRFDLLERAVSLGAVATLTKPVDWEELAELISRVFPAVER